MIGSTDTQETIAQTLKQLEQLRSEELVLFEGLAGRISDVQAKQYALYEQLTESRIIPRQSKQREDCFQKAVIRRGLRLMRRSALRARSFSSP